MKENSSPLREADTQQEKNPVRLMLQLMTGMQRSKLALAMFAGGGLLALAGLVCLISSLFIGSAVFDYVWAVEPLAYIGATALIIGLTISAADMTNTALNIYRRHQSALTPSGQSQGAKDGASQSEQWRETTR